MLRRAVSRFDHRFFRRHLIPLDLIALAQTAFIAGAVFLAALPPAGAQTGPQDASATISARQIQKQGEPGKFDFYLLALSWSPSFCAASRERGFTRTNDPQCGPRPYAFVVHGLWPQTEQGYPSPSNCQVPAPRLPRAIANSMLDLMPSPRLVFHEWDYHGTCTGLSGTQYFDTVRKARGAVTIPEEYRSIAEPLTVKPADVAAAFIRVNAGLKSDALQISCDGKRLTGIRICMNKDLSFHDCAEVSQRSCRAGTVVMPPVRAPHAANAN
jgi:ribonuclease T2